MYNVIYAQLVHICMIHNYMFICINKLHDFVFAFQSDKKYFGISPIKR